MRPTKLLYQYEEPEAVQPLLSIALPTYMNKQYLTKAIRSIETQSEQDCFNFEILIVSNNPEDAMQDIVEYCAAKALPVRIYVNESNYGQVGNINQCIKLSRGDYVAFLHDDDMLLPMYFSIIKKYLKADQVYPCIIPSYYNMYAHYNSDAKHRFLSAVFFPRFFYRKELQKVRPKDHLYAFDDIYGAPSCGTVFHRQSVIAFGLFRDERAAAWDYYNFREFNKKFDIYMLHKYVGIRRSDSGMSSEDRVRQQFLKDKIELVYQEEADDPFIIFYRDTIFSRKPIWKYICFRLRTRWYFYTRNLDKVIGIPKELFKQYHD